MFISTSTQSRWLLQEFFTTGGGFFGFSGSWGGGCCGSEKVIVRDWTPHCALRSARVKAWAVDKHKAAAATDKIFFMLMMMGGEKNRRVPGTLLYDRTVVTDLYSLVLWYYFNAYT